MTSLIGWILIKGVFFLFFPSSFLPSFGGRCIYLVYFGALLLVLFNAFFICLSKKDVDHFF